MQKVDWKNEYSVCLVKIDNQHKKLFDMLNVLIANRKLNVHSKIISETLTNMMHYADYHFKTEDKYMLKYDFPEYETHRKEHREFLKKTSQLCFDAMEGNQMVPLEILKYLESWLVNHILKTDMKLKPLFLQNSIE